MTKIRYVGPFVDGVYFDSPRHGGFTVEHGAVVDIPDPEFAASLLEQPSNWQPAEDKKPTPNGAAKPAEESS